MSPANVSGFTANAKVRGTAAAKLVARCQETIDRPENYRERGGADGDYWPGAAVSCAFAYVTSQQPKYLRQALTYWKASLNDDQTVGDNLGCTVANSTYDRKRKWDGDAPRPPALVTIMHDTGYPLRWYGPYIALIYDWLYDAPGVDETLRAQTRACLTAWVDFYTARGYLRDQPGFNYNAGFVVAKTLSAIAIGTDGGADGHLWTETIHDVFEKMLVGKGLAGATGATGAPGPLVGGDWGSWQYGPLAVAAYAASTRALEDHGVRQPEMAAWVDSVIVRTIHGSLPRMDSQFVGNGDFSSTDVYHTLTANQVDAVLLGPSSERAAAWALFVKQRAKPGEGYFWNALGELRKVAPQDYRTQTPAPLWYVARGLGNMYVRSSWREDALWGVFMSGSPVGDHAHFAASNFVLSRGGDHLIVDSSNYGEPSTLETNAVTADAKVTPEYYALTQTPWGLASLPWARGTAEGVFAARAEFPHAFDYNGIASDIRYAQREWVMLPEGEVITVDRIHTSDDSRGMYVNFHTNTGGTLKFDATTGVAIGAAGGSQVAIHRVHLSGGTPRIVQPPVGPCKLKCNFPCGACDTARFPVDAYSVFVPGSWAVAIHVIDGLAAGERPAEVGSLGDDTIDPPPKLNGGVIGAAVHRATKQSYVVASSARNGAPAGPTMTYGVPGGSPARHIVYDAPEAPDGSSEVIASARQGRCVVSVTAGRGGGQRGRPLMFQVARAADGCAVTPERDAPPAPETPGPSTARR
jgi:hypothetical protein